MDSGNWFDVFVIAMFLISFGFAVWIFHLSSSRRVLGYPKFFEYVDWALHHDRVSAREVLAGLKDTVLSLTQNFGRVYLALFVTFVIGTLLYLKIISPEAGLPILSGIAGFALGNGPSSNTQGPGPTAPAG